MKKKLIFAYLIGITILISSCSSGRDGSCNDKCIAYPSIALTQEDKSILMDYINSMNSKYDDSAKMITKDLDGWNYHTDAQEGTYHEIRGSLEYAVALLDCGEREYQQRAFDVIDSTIALQDTDPGSKSCGVWPYYKEEPLATKKSPIDYNWADFNAVSLLDIYMYHKSQLPKHLEKKIETALILAAKAVQKRDCQPDYTNIAIMGTYVTYLTSHLFNLPEMQEYASKRLKTFYDYTKEKEGFTEYNSPTYSITAINELRRMQRNIIEPEDKKMIDEMYDLCWSVIARHYHKPSAQWAGPHSRSYSTLVETSYYGLLNKASDGKIDLGYKSKDKDVKIRHHIPDSLIHYFVSPEYPRTEIDVFENNEPQIIGTSYLTDDYAIGTASRSSLWNQRRPLTVYWGDIDNPHYMQIRFLHDFYDFSTASIFTKQDGNSILSEINIAKDGGDKHINLDIIKNGSFVAKDLRIRLEFGNCQNTSFALPKHVTDNFTITEEGMDFYLQMAYAKWDDAQCHWEKSQDGNTVCIDCVIYDSPAKTFNLNDVEVAAFAFIMKAANEGELGNVPNASVIEKDGILSTNWNDMEVSIPIKPEDYPSHLPLNYPSNL